MNIIIGSDHAGFGLKEACRRHLSETSNHRVVDAGTFDCASIDYPRVAHQVAQAVANGEYERGILICGTGIGMSMVANRYRKVRAALCHELYTVRMARMHNDANVLAMGGRVIGEGIALEMVDLFLETPFEGGRHALRVSQFD
ncbi:ribose 5-phosphate isomerase B [Desulfatiglans anilini]|uniref:ribose 5-phosphate isomerase B n=1 Tax=Desulfatiglans anilini TaxID=90728 RepID=UPI00040A3CC7|nr:ribose 5-phosphate isomerase B [Desulfatiglans anilini]